jgi:hypothetical protein
MEVHHHAHTERKKWTHYFWEFFMLFLAVTLGFFVENQREHYIEKKRAAEYASELLFDLARDTSRLNDGIDYYTWRENSQDSLISLLSTNNEQYDAPGFYSILRSMDTWRVPVGFSNTYDDLKTSGLLRYFTQDGIAGKLKSYYQQYINFSYYEDELAQYVKDFCEPFLDKYFEGKYYVTQNSSHLYDKPVFPVPQGQKLTITSLVKQALLNMTIRMRYKKIGFENVSSFGRSQKKTANDLIILLKKKYHLD